MNDTQETGVADGSLWRVFLAVWPDSEALDALEPIDRWVLRHDSHRLTPREQRHLTIAFLGDVESTLMPTLAELLSPVVAAYSSFDAPITGVLTLPTERSPRIVAARIEGARISSLMLQVLEAIDGLMDCDPVQRDLLREPTPHITVARSRRAARARQLDVSKAPTLAGRLRVDSIRAVRSRLTDKGPIYTPIRSINLTEAGEVGS
jgi:2'-5' RNA ligase